MNTWDVYGSRIDDINVNYHFLKDESDGHIKVKNFLQNWFLQEAGLFKVSTSGSTGKKKSLVFRRSQLEESSRMTASAIGLTSAMNSLLAMDPSFIAGQMMMARALTIGMNLTIQKPSANPFEGLEDHEIDFLSLVPYQVNSILQSDNYWHLNRLKVLLIGGGPINADLLTKIKHLDVPTFHSYGMTETLSHIALRSLSGSEQQDSFYPLEGVHLDLDERECLVIDAPFLEDTVVTNDIVKLNHDGSFDWLGRIDNMINSGGIKLFPEKLEIEYQSIFKALGIKNEFILIGYPDSKLGQKLVLVFEGDRFEKGVRQELVKEFQDQLEPYTIPKDIIFVDSFQRTETGKIKRSTVLSKI